MSQSVQILGGKSCLLTSLPGFTPMSLGNQFTQQSGLDRDIHDMLVLGGTFYFVLFLSYHCL